MRIRACSVFLLYCLLVTVAGCSSKSEVIQQSSSTQPASSPQQPAPASGAASNTQSQQQNPSGATGSADAAKDACALITGAEIQEVQGEPLKDTKSSSRSSGALEISQCFYSLPTYNKSVSLEVTRNNPASAGQSGAVKEFWNKTFHRKEAGQGAEEEGDKAKEGAEEERGRGEEEKEEASKPRPVPDIGDEAFWAGNAKAGALYVLKNNAFIRISIGGPGDESAKIDKSRALARKALARL